MACRRLFADTYIARVPDLGDVPWPPDPITTDRLILRSTREADRPSYIELLCREDVQRFLGGAHDRDEVTAAMPSVPGHRPGVFAVEAAGEFIGVVILDRRSPERPGHVSESACEVEISYLFAPAWWGNGYATEACVAALAWADRYLASEPIVLCTQVANEASVRLAARLGFREVERFVEFDAEQWFGVREARDHRSH
jgi:RimJ/RimL family protein N-acetyltransferase